MHLKICFICLFLLRAGLEYLGSTKLGGSDFSDLDFAPEGLAQVSFQPEYTNIKYEEHLK